MNSLKLISIGLACLLSCFAYSQEDNTDTSPTSTEEKVVPPPKENDEIFTIVQQMPRFPGCEDMKGTEDQKKKCAEKKMLEYIYKNIQYPEEAKKKGIEGMAVVSFVIEKDGRITNPKLIRDLSGGCGEEALRVVNSMPNWMPGRQRNQPVRVQFNLPVRFKLEGNSRSSTSNSQASRRSPQSSGYVKIKLQNTASYSFSMRMSSQLHLDPRGSRQVTLRVGEQVSFQKGFKYFPLFVVTSEMNYTVIDVSKTAKLRNKGNTEDIVYIKPPRNQSPPPTSNTSTSNTQESDPVARNLIDENPDKSITEYYPHGAITRHPKLRAIANTHKTIAIVPANVMITNKKLNKKNNPEKIVEKEKEFQVNFQSSLYERMLRMRENGRLKVEVQDIATTNKLLAENGLEDVKALLGQEHFEIADMLGVDAVLSADVEISQILSKGGALALGVIVGNSATPTESSIITLYLYDGYTSARIWSLSQQYDNNSLFLNPKKLIEFMFQGEFGTKFPYHVRF